ncbi:hypothetical protein [Kroppenstedtia sanguinis]
MGLFRSFADLELSTGRVDEVMNRLDRIQGGFWGKSRPDSY